MARAKRRKRRVAVAVLRDAIYLSARERDMLANHATRSIRTAPIYDAETVLTQLLGISRATLFAWLSGDATSPSHVRISPDLIAFVRRGKESS